jgi:signal transduction histidine kinase
VTIALPKPSVGDVVLTAAFLTLGQLTTWLQLDAQDAFAGSRPANAVLLALGALPLLWRRFYPAAVVALAVTFLCLPHTVADLDVTLLGQFVPLIVVTASCGYHATAGRALLGAAFAVAGMLVVSWTTLPVLRTPSSLVFNLLVLLAPWAAARALRHREDRARRLGAALADERSQFEGRMTETVERERAAIARDLHDIVAHGVSVMVVQIGGARMQLTENPDRAAQSLLQAEDAGRQALADLRRMLGVLRASPATTDTQPRPGLRHLEALIQQMGNAGLQVQTYASSSLDGLLPAIDISAYRIVQEALTNVLKHSTAVRAHLRIEVTGKLLSIFVRDGGPPRHENDREGHGLVGIRERVAFFGGQSRIGRDESGGWEVTVSIPLSRTSDLATVPEGTHT